MTDTPCGDGFPATQQPTLRGGLVARIQATATELADLQQVPAPVLLAHARRGFVLAGAVSRLLDRYAVPQHDNFTVADQACEETVVLLSAELGPHLLRRYPADTRAVGHADLTSAGVTELAFSTEEDLEAIAAAMVTLVVTLQDILEAVAGDESLPSAIRDPDADAARNADVVSVHYGGDSAGW